MARRRFHVGYAPTFEAAHALKLQYAEKAKEEGLDSEYQVRRRADNFEVVVRLSNQQATTVSNARKEDEYSKRKRNRKRRLPEV